MELIVFYTITCHTYIYIKIIMLCTSQRRGIVWFLIVTYRKGTLAIFLGQRLLADETNNRVPFHNLPFKPYNYPETYLMPALGTRFLSQFLFRVHFRFLIPPYASPQYVLQSQAPVRFHRSALTDSYPHDKTAQRSVPDLP